MIKYTQTTSLVSLFIDSSHFVVNKADGRFPAVIKALKNEEWDLVRRYVDPTVALNLPHLKIINYVFYWKDQPLPENFYKIFLELVSSNRSLIPYIYCIIDNREDAGIMRIIETFCQNKNYIMPLDNSGRKFVYSKDSRSYNYESNSLESKIFIEIFKGEYQQLNHIKEDTYEQFLVKKYGNSVLSGILKNADTKYNLAVLEKIHDCISHFKYTKEDIEFLYKTYGSVHLTIHSLYCTNRFFNTYKVPSIKRLFLLFSSMEKLKNWISKSFHGELDEVLDNIRRINAEDVDDILKDFVARSSGFDELLLHLLNLVASTAFACAEIKFAPPQGLKKYIYNVDASISIRFPFSNKDLYGYGVVYKNCAFSYVQQILDQRSIVFSVVIDLKNKFLVEIVKSETKKSYFNTTWNLKQFVGYANSSCRSAEDLIIKKKIIKKLNEIGLLMNPEKYSIHDE